MRTSVACWMACYALLGAARADDAAYQPDPSGGAGGKAGTFGAEKLDVAGQSREYRLVAPKSIVSTTPCPLLFAFHGLGDSKDLMPLYTQLGRLAEKEGCLLVYPNGKNRHWPLVPQLAKDDVAFFDALYDHLTTQYNVDRNRVFLTGMSNGAYFSNLVASQRSEKIAAIALHSGGLGALAFGTPEIKHKYAVFAVHGAEDSIVKVEEGRKTRDSYQKWGHPVEYLEAPGLNHFWAHGADVNRKMWQFFAAHPRQLSPVHPGK